jgi:hypothetical protein
MGEMSEASTGDRVGREKFSTDLELLMLGVVAGRTSSFGGGAGRGGVRGRSGMTEDDGDRGWGEDWLLFKVAEVGKSSTAMPLISAAGC